MARAFLICRLRTLKRAAPQGLVISIVSGKDKWFTFVHPVTLASVSKWNSRKAIDIHQSLGTQCSNLARFARPGLLRPVRSITWWIFVSFSVHIRINLHKNFVNALKFQFHAQAQSCATGSCKRQTGEKSWFEVDRSWKTLPTWPWKERWAWSNIWCSFLTFYFGWVLLSLMSSIDLLLERVAHLQKWDSGHWVYDESEACSFHVTDATCLVIHWKFFVI